MKNLTGFLLPALAVVIIVSGLLLFPAPQKQLDAAFDVGFVGTAEAGVIEFDILCTGANDNIPIQAALNALPVEGGGQLRLWDMDSDYIHHSYQWQSNSTVTRDIDNVTINGMGASTQLSGDGSTPLFTVGGEHWLFSHLSMDAGGIDKGNYTDAKICECWIGGEWVNDCDTVGNSTGNVTYFTDLADVPGNYTGHAGQTLIVNGNETALDFGNVTSGNTNLQEGYILIGNSSNLAEGVELTGDASLNSLGELTVYWADQAQLCDEANYATEAGDSDTLDGSHASAFLGASAKASDSDKLDGYDSSYFLSTTGKAADSDKLDGQHGSYYLSTTGTAADSDKLDGIDSASFLQVEDLVSLEIQASSVVRNSNDAEKLTNSATYVKLKEIQINGDLAACRVYVQIRMNSSGTGYCRVYKNGVAVGAEHTTTSGSYVAFTDDLSGLVSGDLIQVYCHTTSSYWMYVRYQKLEYSEFITDIGAYELYTPIQINSDCAISVTNQDP